MWLARRRKIAERYDTAFAKVPAVEPLHTGKDALHAYHLYVVRFDTDRLRTDRAGVFAALRSAGVGVNVHYIPVHLHPFYRERFGTGPGLCPVAEAAYEQIISLPLFPGMDDLDVEYVIEAVCEVSERFGYSVDDTRKGYHFFGVGYPAERAPMPVCADHA
jgi:perosamine synthetase